MSNSENLTPLYVPAGTGTPLNVMGSFVLPKVVGKQSAGTLFFAEISGDAGTGVPLHTHTREDETFYILEGEVEFTAEGRKFVARPGDVVFGPRNVPHAYLALTPIKMLVLVTPAGIEAMFEALAALPPGPPDMQRTLEICAEAGISFG